MRHYTSTARKDSRWWVVQCDQEPTALSQVARLDQAVAHQREAIAFVTELPVDDIEVEVTPVLDQSVQDLIQRATHDRARAEQLGRAASAGFREAARTLTANGYSLRDIGAILGVSFQRAGQLVND